jgi:hypothetical protein
MRHALAVPAWVVDGWYANNPDKQQLAIARYFIPVTTLAERAAARAFVLTASAACVSCGCFAFPTQGTRCWWCRSLV